MRAEATHKKFDIPNYLKRWINIKKVFPIHLFDKSKTNHVQFVKDVQKSVVRGMPDMLNLCELELIGKHHSGIDDAKNIANVVVNLLEKGFEFHQGMVLSHSFTVEGSHQNGL